MAAVRSQLTDFEIEEFFRSLQGQLISSLNPNISLDTAEFLCRRLDGYERNLNVLYTRLRESLPRQEEMLTDLHNLKSIVLQRRMYCEALSFRDFLEDEQHINGQATVSVSSDHGISRLSFNVPQELLKTLPTRLGFSWAQIAGDLGISERTLRRRRRLYEMPSSGPCFSPALPVPAVRLPFPFDLFLCVFDLFAIPSLICECFD